MQLLSKNGKALKAIGFSRAMDLMRLPGTRLIKSRSGDSEFAHYVVPGGYVEPDVAEKIKKHPQVTASQDGLWPGLDQTWRVTG
jgi:hypothetical protein